MAHDLSPAFRSGLRGIVEGEIIIPPLRNYLADPEFHGFTIEVKQLGRREPNGWHWPSQHPSWPDRAIWLYHLVPSLLMDEPMEAQNILAMTAGSIWHAVVERALMDIGLLVTNEVKFADESTKSRGSADGLMKAHSGQQSSEELFEFKTAKDMLLRKINSVEDFKKKYPTYWDQATEYLRLSGYRKMRVLMMALTFPFEMKEFVIEYDQVHAETTANKYRRVLQAVADKNPPMCSNCPKATHCPARAVCETVPVEQIVSLLKGPIN